MMLVSDKAIDGYGLPLSPCDRYDLYDDGLVRWRRVLETRALIPFNLPGATPLPMVVMSVYNTDHMILLAEVTLTVILHNITLSESYYQFNSDKLGRMGSRLNFSVHI